MSSRDGYGYRKVARAQKELAEFSQFVGKIPPRKLNRRGGFVVTFGHGDGEQYESIRVLVRAESRAAALHRALEMESVAEWLPEHPDSTASIMSAGLIIDEMPEGQILKSVNPTVN